MSPRQLALLALLALFAFGPVACSDTEEEDPINDGVVEPDPQPDPEPIPEAAPDPQPTPDPNPVMSPDPEPTPDPQPEPTPDPMPDPMPDAMPDPEPEQMNGLCPPEGPFGMNEGDTAADFTLTDCEGNPYSLHDLCAHKVSWIFEFALWCPPCRTFARTFPAIMDRLEGQDLGVYFVITNDDRFQPPTAQVCRDVVAQFGLEGVTVLFDPDGTMDRTFDVPVNDINILMSEGNIIEFKRQYANSEVEAEVQRLLER